MNNSEGIKKGNLLDLYINGQDTKFVNDNLELTSALKAANIRVYIEVQKVVSVDNDKINGIAIENFEPIFLDNNWLTKLNVIPHQDGNIQIGKLNFKRKEIALEFCSENFEPIAGEKIICYVHQLQNFYTTKTEEELQIHYNL